MLQMFDHDIVAYTICIHVDSHYRVPVYGESRSISYLVANFSGSLLGSHNSD